MKKNGVDKFYDLFIDINSRVAVAFGLAIIALLLVYIAFFK